MLEVLGERLPEAEISLFFLPFQLVAYGIAMAIANVCYGLGPLVESMVPAALRSRFRRRAFAAGCVFSFTLPHLIPLAVWGDIETTP